MDGLKEPPSGRRGSHLVCVWKPLFGRNRFTYTMGDLQICSEDQSSRGWAVESSPKLNRERQSHLHTSPLSPLLCRRALVSLGISGTFLAFKGTHSVYELAYPT